MDGVLDLPKRSNPTHYSAGILYWSEKWKFYLAKDAKKNAAASSAAAVCEVGDSLILGVTLPSIHVF